MFALVCVLECAIILLRISVYESDALSFIFSFFLLLRSVSSSILSLLSPDVLFSYFEIISSNIFPITFVSALVVIKPSGQLKCWTAILSQLSPTHLQGTSSSQVQDPHN